MPLVISGCSSNVAGIRAIHVSDFDELNWFLLGSVTPYWRLRAQADKAALDFYNKLKEEVS